jgi:hypothetical protein
MKGSIRILFAVVLLAVGAPLLFLNCKAQASQAALEENPNYVIKYEWPEKPRVGHYTLRVMVSDKSGNPVPDIEVIAKYDMPSMRGRHNTEEKMKRSDRGDFLLPIYFAMRGGWEIILFVTQDDGEIARKTITLSI